jgi:hypothetical protein
MSLKQALMDEKGIPACWMDLSNRIEMSLSINGYRASFPPLTRKVMNTHATPQVQSPTTAASPESTMDGFQPTAQLQYAWNLPTLQLQAAANASPQVQQFRALQAGINQSPQVQQLRQQQAGVQAPIQRMKYDKKKHQRSITAASEVLMEDEALIQECWEWAESRGQFDAFTQDSEAWGIYRRVVLHGISSLQIEEATGGNSLQVLEQAHQLIEVKTQKARQADEDGGKVKPEPPKDKGKGAVPDVLDLGVNLIQPKQRPPVGKTLAHVKDAHAVKGEFPSTLVLCMEAAAAAGKIGAIQVGAPVLLKGGKGTDKETVEIEAWSGTYSFVVHYHPKAAIPDGVFNGESNVHVKGDRKVKHHETMDEGYLAGLGIATLDQIKAMDLK